MKIAIITTHPPIQFSNFYDELSMNQKFQLKVFFSSDGCREYREMYKIDIALKRRQKHFYAKQKESKFRLFRYLNIDLILEFLKYKPDYVIYPSWDTGNFFVTFILSKILGIKICLAGDATIDTSNTAKLKTWSPKRKLFSAIVNNANFLFYRGVKSQKLYELFTSNKEKFFYYPPPVKLHLLINRARNNENYLAKIRRKYDLDNQKIILFVGRLSQEKEIIFALDVFLKMSEKQVTFVIVGDGEMMAEVKKYAEHDNIKITGYLPKKEIERLMRISQFLILPSSYEPHGAVVREAYANGLSVVCSDKVGAAYDLVVKVQPDLVFQSMNFQSCENAMRLGLQPYGMEETKKILRQISKQDMLCIINDLGNFFQKNRNN